MNKIFYFSLLLAFGLSACSPSHQIAPTSEEAITVPSTNEDLQLKALEIMGVSCLSCHGSASPGYGGIDYLENVQNMIDRGMVSPGNPEASLLFSEITSGSMPPAGSVKEEDIEFLRLWIISLNKEEEGGGEEGSEPPVEAKTFTQVYDSVIGPKCATCHNASHEIPLIDYDSVLQLTWVGNASASPIWDAPNEGRMPASGPLLSSEDLADLSGWINAGALNN